MPNLNYFLPCLDAKDAGFYGDFHDDSRARFLFPFLFFFLVASKFPLRLRVDSICLADEFVEWKRQTVMCVRMLVQFILCCPFLPLGFTKRNFLSTVL